MTMLVHLIDERDAKSARRVGILGQPATFATAEDRLSLPKAVFAMPVLPNFYASHQWLRELKRRGMRTVCAAYFRLRSDAIVWVGRYNGEHRRVPLGHAAGLIMHEPDPRGWQLLLPGSVPARAIMDIREVPQVVGWRYFPESHVKGPWKCLCDFCLRGQKGDIKANRMRAALIERYGAENLGIEGDIKQIARPLRKKRKK